MSGPVPKPASQRRRRNVSTTARTLRPVSGEVEIPKLPTRRIDGRPAKWRAETLDWWQRLWHSPMAPEFDDSDLDGLRELALLIDKFWREQTVDLAREVRLQRAEFGLSPISRRRLQWEIDRGEEAAQRTAERRSPKAATVPDPRAITG